MINFSDNRFRSERFETKFVSLGKIISIVRKSKEESLEAMAARILDTPDIEVILYASAIDNWVSAIESQSYFIDIGQWSVIDCDKCSRALWLLRNVCNYVKAGNTRTQRFLINCALTPSRSSLIKFRLTLSIVSRETDNRLITNVRNLSRRARSICQKRFHLSHDLC